MASPPICDAARTAWAQPLLALPISPLCRAERLTVMTRTKAGRRRFRLLAPGGVTCAVPNSLDSTGRQVRGEDTDNLKIARRA